ncbi:MAG: PKD domain-containing protein [Sumerlaeia bacterium]
MTTETQNCWAYLEKLDDRGFFEDHLVGHALTGHKAILRLYSENFSTDETAWGAVKKQAELAGPKTHPSIPAIFDIGTWPSGQKYVLFERIPGESLQQAVERLAGRDPRKLAFLLLPLLARLRELRDLGVAFDRLRLENIVFHDGVPRIVDRWPVASADPASAGGSPFLERLLQSPMGGVYVCAGKFPQERSFNRIKNILFYLASSQTEKNLTQALESGGHLSVESELQPILMGMHDPAGPGGLRTLEDVERELRKLAQPVAEDLSRSSSMALVSQADVSRGRVSAAPAASAPASVTAPPAPRLAANAPAADPASDNEDMSHLYPTRRASGSSSTKTALTDVPLDKSPPAASADKLAMAARRQKSPSNAGKYIKIGALAFGAVLLLAGLVAGALFAISLFTGGKNNPPVAAIAPPDGPLRVNEPATLDASPSSDPDGDALSYEWRVLELDPQYYTFSRNKSTEAQRPTVQFFQSGEYTVTLRVFDGTTYSEPVQTRVTVESGGGRF